MSSEMNGYQCVGQGMSGLSPAIAAMKVGAGSSRDVDLFAQASKCLSERSPFDVLPKDGAGVSGVVATMLPSSLASLLRHANSRRKHKRLHSGGQKKSSKKRQSERSKAGLIWVESDEYFRVLGLNDIDGLHDACCSVSELERRKCMLIPFLDSDNSHVHIAVSEDEEALDKENKEGEHEQLIINQRAQAQGGLSSHNPTQVKKSRPNVQAHSQIKGLAAEDSQSRSR